MPRPKRNGDESAELSPFSKNGAVPLCENKNLTEISLLFHSVFAKSEIGLVIIGVLVFAVSPTMIMVWLLPAPLVVLMLFSRAHTKLNIGQVRQLQNLFGKSGLTVFRISKEGVCHVYSTPFLSIICLSNKFVESPDSPESRAIILHELGHKNQYDWPVIWALTLLPYVGFMYTMAIIDGRYGWFGLAEDSGEDGLGTIYVTTWVLMFAMCCVFLIAGIKYAIHRREFRADLFAMQRDRCAFQFLLSERVARERKLAAFPDSTRLYDRLKIGYFHPSWEKRLATQQNGFTPGNSILLFYSIYWAFFASTLVQLAFRVHINHGYIIGNQNSYQAHTALSAAIFLVLIVQNNVLQIAKYRKYLPRMTFISALLGYTIGILFSAVIGQYLEYYQGAETSLSALEYVGIGIASVLSWIMAYLALILLFRWRDKYCIAQALGLISAGLALGASHNQIKYSADISLFELSVIPIMALLIGILVRVIFYIFALFRVDS